MAVMVMAFLAAFGKPQCTPFARLAQSTRGPQGQTDGQHGQRAVFEHAHSSIVKMHAACSMQQYHFLANMMACLP
ncbi:hypothetical protein BA896_015570 [Janthinobacterium lividum]|uniref:Uncharacterized protein n=1 Tax=Janthinobacterium lividum TaxID=29581 RepID=A0A1E8PM45_9BURK|nr:hypothetical protein BA896_015570 [Janthinobacterium lividum]